MRSLPPLVSVATIVLATACGAPSPADAPPADPPRSDSPAPIVWPLSEASAEREQGPAEDACIEDPAMDLLRTLDPTPALDLDGATDDWLATQTLDDVDGDGEPEKLLAATALCGATGNCSYRLYLSNHGCARFAGEIDGASFQLGEEKHAGVRDIQAYWKGGCAGQEGTIAELVFDGNEFTMLDSSSCLCPDDPDFARWGNPERCSAFFSNR